MLQKAYRDGHTHCTEGRGAGGGAWQKMALTIRELVSFRTVAPNGGLSGLRLHDG